MSKLNPAIVISAIILTVILLMRPQLAPAAEGGSLTDAQYDEIRIATEKYHDSELAKKEGFVSAPACVYLPGVGGEGYHFINPANMADNVIDPTRPDALLYERLSNGYLQLIGVEYLIPDADQNVSTVEQHFLYNQPLMGPMLPHAERMPIHYDLHVYLYKPGPGPNGMFAPWNPRVSCIYAK